MIRLNDIYLVTPNNIYLVTPNNIYLVKGAPLKKRVLKFEFVKDMDLDKNKRNEYFLFWMKYLAHTFILLTSHCLRQHVEKTEYAKTKTANNDAVLSVSQIILKCIANILML